MKIDIVTPFFYPIVGGAEVYVYELSKRLSKRGHKIRVHTAIYDFNGNKFQKYEMIDGFEVFRYTPFIRKFYYYWFWSPIINQTDIIHVCGYGHVCFTLTVWKYYKKFPLVATTAGVSALIEGPKSRFLRHVYDDFIGMHQLKLFKKIIVWALEEKEWCIKRKIPEHLIKKIPIGVPEESYKNYEPNKFIKSCGLFDKKYLLYLGRIHVQKGLDILIKTFALIANKYDVKLVLVGPDNGFLNEVFSLADKYGLKDKILWLNTLVGKEKYEIINGCEFLLLPSKYELQGIVLVEAMAQGKPVIATNVGGIPDFVKDGENGFIVEYGDVKNLAKKIEKLLTDKNTYLRLSTNAKITAEKFRWEKIIDEYEEIYKEVLNKP
ncbi:MAG: glycosyltransferase family 4 protein [candidate division WOR-3 bacterium]